MNKVLVCFLFVINILSACHNPQADKAVESIENSKAEKEEKATAPSRIVSLSGVLTETVVALGHQSKIVGVDITSTYPEKVVADLPKLGHISSVQSEGILSLKPEVVLVLKKGLNQELKTQLETVGVKVVVVDQTFSIEGTKKIISQIGSLLGEEQKADSLNQKIDQDLAQLVKLEAKPKALFIYARGAGNMSVGGKGTAVAELIKIAGGENVADEFEGYKPLTAEAMVEANPDAILMFQRGLQSLSGKQGMKEIPAVAQTNAAKNDRFIGMEGLFMAGFGPRVGEAALELNQTFASFSDE